MKFNMETERVANRIKELSILLHEKKSLQRAKEINDILIYGDKISLEILQDAWDYFAYKKGIKNSDGVNCNIG
jgi:hypothetical protein